MCLPMTLWLSGARLCIPTHRFTIRRRDITPLAWRFHSASASRWVPFGAGEQDGAVAGATTISTLITTIISSAMKILTAENATTFEAEIGGMPVGSTIRN